MVVAYVSARDNFEQRGKNDTKEFATNWRMPVELAYAPVPRRLSLRGEAWVMPIVAAGIAAFIMADGFSLYREWISENQVFDTLLAHGVEANAKIMRKWIEQRPDTCWYYVSYSLQANGRTFSPSKSVDWSAYRQLREGQMAPVVYLSSDPSINRLTVEPPPVKPWVALFFPLICGGLLSLFILPIRRQWLVVSTGKATAGVVTGSRRVEGFGLSTIYEFRDRAGVKRVGKTTVRSNDAPRIGATVTILFDPENPRRNVLYPAPLVCLAT